MLLLPSSVLHVVKALPDDQDLQPAPAHTHPGLGGLYHTPPEVHRYIPWHNMAYVSSACKAEAGIVPLLCQPTVVDYRGP